MTVINETLQLIKEDVSESFSVKVPVEDVTLTDEGKVAGREWWFTSGSAVVSFTLDIESRSWGIKSVGFSFGKSVDIDLYFEDEEHDNEEKTIRVNVDLNQLRVEEVAGDGFTVDHIDLTIKEDNSVDYSNSTLFVKKNRGTEE